jgi:hypothetical protein
MQGVSTRVRRGASLLILMASVLATPVFADDTASSYVAVDAQISAGTTAADEPPTVWEEFVLWLEARIHIPLP